MLHATRTLTTAALVAVALAATACATTRTTEGDGGATVEPAGPEGYLAAVEARCADVNDEIDALEEQFPDETPEDAAGYLDGWADAVDGFVVDVRAMDAPDDMADGTETVLTSLDDVVAAFHDAADQVEGGEGDVEAAAGPAFAALGPASAAAADAWDINLETCGEEEVVADPDAAQVTVTATEYAFDIPEVSAGRTAITLHNEGEEPHFMYVVRLKDGATIEEALAAEESGGDPDEFVEEEIGESTTAVPGGTAVINADLAPGTYAMLCFISNDEGAPHAALGMAQEFTVE